MFTFVGQVFKNYKTTGAVAPSSAFLARAMTTAARRHDGPKRILEVGPGTGAFTRHILKTLRPGDAFHIVEINPVFCRTLEEQILRPFRAKNPAITIELHNHPIETAPVEGAFDYIVCGLPFNLFPLTMVRRIFRRMMSLLREDGELTYFEYFGMKAIRMPWVGKRGRRGLRRRIALTRMLDRRYRGKHSVVLTNLPPARAFKLRG